MNTLWVGVIRYMGKYRSGRANTHRINYPFIRSDEFDLDPWAIVYTPTHGGDHILVTCSVLALPFIGLS